MSRSMPIVVNGWTLYTHPLFVEQVRSLSEKVEALKAKDPQGYKTKNVTKRLAAIYRLTFETIPQDPTIPEYRQGKTLGAHNKHWFRAKFFQQYRLFFRYHAKSKVIVYSWVNDEKSKRAYESKSDAYKTFAQMIETGNPPSDWNALLNEAKKTNM